MSPHRDLQEVQDEQTNVGAIINSNVEEYKILKNIPVTEKSIKIHRLLTMSKIPIIGDRYLKKIPRLFTNSKHVEISRGFFCIYGNIDAEDVSLNDTICLDYGLIKIGRHTSFSLQNMILTSYHDLDDFNKVIVKPITIGKNVRITTRVIILAGVTIGDNSVIGAGSVVTRDIPPGVFGAGAPCRVIKKITTMGRGF